MKKILKIFLNNDYINNDTSKNMVFVFLYAIGSIFIVAGHCSKGGINFLFDFFPVSSFHLGLFMFCSGYFYKEKNEKEFLKYAWKKFKRFIIPMFIWNIVYAIFVQVIRLKGFTIGKDITLYNLFVSPIINGHQFIFTMCLWYIPSLFLVEIITCFIRKIISKFIKINEYIFFIFYLALGLLGIYLSNKGFNTGWPLLVARTLYFFPFFAIGILYNKKLEKIDKIKNIFYFAFLFLVTLIIFYINKKTITFTPSWCKNFPQNIILPYIVGFTGIAFWLRIAKIFEPITQKSKTINKISENAYPIMIHQFLGFFAVNTIYALFSKFTPLFSDFNFNKFKSDIWYFYKPRGMGQFLILYLVAGIVVPIIIDKFIKLAGNGIKTAFKKINKHIRRNNIERNI